MAPCVPLAIISNRLVISTTIDMHKIIERHEWTLYLLLKPEYCDQLEGTDHFNKECKSAVSLLK